MMDKASVLDFVKNNGPVIPRDVSKKFGGDTFITGAILSQLVDGKELKISHAKIGGSPVYYCQNQEEKLNILYKFLPGKEKEAFDQLQANKIIRDVEAAPAIRVALRNIKDFAKPVDVIVGEDKEIFWKWYLTPNQEVELAIRQILSPGQKEEKKTNSQPKEEPKAQEPALIKETQKEPEKKEQIIQTPENQEMPKEQEKKEKIIIPQPKEEKTKSEQKPIKKEDKQETLKEEKALAVKDSLLSRIIADFSKKRIEILETEIIRKNTELELIIKIPSSVGNLKYFCKVRDKKKSTDKDLSSVYVQGQMKKLPVLYVTTGDVTKKAIEMLDTEFKMISIMQL
jgi:hypothetical protein